MFAGKVYVARPWPALVPNPAKFRWYITCEHRFVGAARTVEQARKKCVMHSRDEGGESG